MRNNGLHSSKFNIAPEKMMVGRLYTLIFGDGKFGSGYVKLPGGISRFCRVDCGSLW